MTVSRAAGADRPKGEASFDVAELTKVLQREIRGTVRDDATLRAMYAADASNYRSTPQLVVRPSDTGDLAAIAAACAAAGAPTVPRGGGTSMAGNAIGGVIVDTGGLRAIEGVDSARKVVRVQPGVVLSDLNAALRPHGLTFPVDPSSASRATLGGMIANNACGAHSVVWGTTADNVRALDVVLSDGTALALRSPHGDPESWARTAMPRGAAAPGREGQLHRRLQSVLAEHAMTIERRFGGELRRRISGYALDRLLPGNGYDLPRFLCGTEGTCAITATAELAVVAPPPATVLLVLGFASGPAAASSVPTLLEHAPLTVESINDELVSRLPSAVRGAAEAAGLPEGRTWLLVDLGGADVESAQRSALAARDAVRDAGVPAGAAIVTDPGARATLWRCRRDGTGLATRRGDGKQASAGWEDAAVPPSRLGEYLTRLDELMGRYGYTGASYGHFGEGCMHMRMDFDLRSDGGVASYRAFVEDATDLVVRLGGSVSGEHGDGRARSELLARMYGADVVSLFAEVKKAWDPAGVLNPGIIADARPIDAELRWIGMPRLRAVSAAETFFAYAGDEGSFESAQRRCVGVAKCRQSSGSVMCPSYQATGEEEHSTRGRARILAEMVAGDTITGGWRSVEVRDALDLCLSCKGCLSDCPVNVDMATYKAEFLAHHYHGRVRPRSHYSMGWLPLWLRLGSRFPALVNKVSSSFAAPWLKRAGGVAGQRDIPRLAEVPFVAANARVPVSKGRHGRVVLWPDTFTNYLTPEVGHAAREVLVAAGFEVGAPGRPVCCGLTWITTGQLRTARRVIRRTLDAVASELDSGARIVFVEPSCLAAVRHDLPALLPGDERAARLAASAVSFAELLAGTGDWRAPSVDGTALVQTHCHHNAVIGTEADREVMARAGLRASTIEPTCCGLAGNFGFEAEHYEVSMAIGERVVLPAVRAAAPDTHLVADGFSCRTQIATTGRRARHLAEVLADALDTEPAGSLGGER